MLIDKSNRVELNDIVTIKLISGEEIVGRLVDRQIDCITLAKPIRIGMEPIGPQQMGLAMLPILGSVAHNSPMQFPLNALAIRPLHTGDDVKSNYIQATSGIVPASSSQIPG